MFLRVTLDDGRDHLYNLARVIALFPYKGTRLALDLGKGSAVYTRNNFQATVASLYATGDIDGMVLNAAERA
jgi:hypothetical protein